MIQLTSSTDVLYYLTIIVSSVVKTKMKSDVINCANNKRSSYIFQKRIVHVSYEFNLFGVPRKKDQCACTIHLT